ncbi:hypothetical protein H9Q69_009193 [Fusarium xylarioides]|uniref:Uncharacterized protein n=1 Tax=Fusarium xylarioides TaxID=221167 RepID=A0A9P7LIU9_9HYPO|nr:hypothetical protein H9Q72_008790 [Fusarium xylarioides]KAG5791761.1 hypothetical protein H9Q69_009193 [Fusarium xylarioides]KAG5809352.1 hypothetical protein H9Q71_006279 [Fusarium xylarioides]KAG5821569.1 hypothetical protein H9Q74_008174 [Fusarium xylarioides]
MDIEQVIQSEPFRDANKNPVNGALEFNLHDFMPDNLCQDCSNTPFSISYRDMSNMSTKAERRQRIRARKDVPESLPKSSIRVRKRRLSESSEDRIKAGWR